MAGMEILRPGIAGFASQSEVDFAAFKKAVHTAALDVGASVLSTVAANILTPSFHRAHVRFNRSEFSVICNSHFPVFAFAEWPVRDMDVRARDVPELRDALVKLGVEVATVEELNRQVGP